MMKKEKQPLRLWLKFFRAVLGAIMVSFFGDIVILILSGSIFEIGNINDFLSMLLLSGFVALIFAGIPTFIAYFIIEFISKQYRTICVYVYAMILGFYLEILFHNFLKTAGTWILGSIIAVVITELILREKNTMPQKQAEEIE
ncbi:MAG: hypothetical protein IJR46_07180 [Neisseriaceae bacterium]|nr:hypothetical protein [Neisseriaceae bacterium]